MKSTLSLLAPKGMVHPPHYRYQCLKLPTAFLIQYDNDAPTMPHSIVAPAPRPYIPPPAVDPAEADAATWQRWVTQTAATLRQAGLPESEIKAVIANMLAYENGEDPMQRHILAEHSEPAPEPSAERHEQHEHHKPQRKSPENVRK